MASIKTMKLKIISLENENNSLVEQLKFEKMCNKIDNILNKEKYDKMYNTAVQISRDFLKYVEEKNRDSECDESDCYDSEEDYSDTCSPPVSFDEMEEVHKTFGL